MGGGGNPVGSGGHEGGGEKHFSVTQLGSVLCGVANVSTKANDGFLYVAAMAGAPEKPATKLDGLVPLVVDTKNKKLMLFIEGAWKGVTLS